jgi:ParB family chromosome partitioning protein
MSAEPARRRPSGLGRGLSSLLGEAQREEPVAPGGVRSVGVQTVAVAAISPHPGQPRRHFDEDALNDLANSIATRGLIQPIIVRPHDGGFQIVAGERRWRAAQRAQLHEIPVIVRDFDDAETLEIALVENIQREDLNAIEEAEGYRQLIERHGHTQEDVGKIVHKSRSHVANLLRLLDLPEFVRLSLVSGDFSMGHARAVATAPDPESLTRDIVAKGLSVRQAEARARRAKEPKELVLDKGHVVDPDLAALERQLGDMLGLKVQVAHKGQGGTVTLHYSSLDQLDLVCQRLSGEPI